MPNLNFNAGFEPDENSGGGENLSSLGFHTDDEETEDLDEEKDPEAGTDEEDSPFAKATGDKDFDLDGEEEDEVKAPSLGDTISGPVIATADEDEEDDEAEEEDEGESSFAEATEDKELTEESADAEAVADETDEDEEEAEEDYDEEEIGEDSVIVSKAKIILARQLLDNIQASAASLVSLFGGLLDDGDEERISIAEISDGLIDDNDEGGRVIEGVFNGENMIGPDGKEYSVPANYASKSKLVEGDMLKLTITDRGTFIYKQTKPVERKRLIGKLEKDANGSYLVKAEHKKFRVITASITYYKGIAGDKVVLLVPVAGDSAWGAVDNVIKSK